MTGSLKTLSLPTLPASCRARSSQSLNQNDMGPQCYFLSLSSVHCQEVSCICLLSSSLTPPPRQPEATSASVLREVPRMQGLGKCTSPTPHLHWVLGITAIRSVEGYMLL